ncbi:sensor histidine kinase [Pseudonocardia phyllosphaerae]|uniref:sensor histidine kinase n=1 Tax=Pseudonocardia phyllosphaerae TaxID=3390502 RepID=UPI00397CC46C
MTGRTEVLRAPRAGRRAGSPRPLMVVLELLAYAFWLLVDVGLGRDLNGPGYHAAGAVTGALVAIVVLARYHVAAERAAVVALGTSVLLSVVAQLGHLRAFSVTELFALAVVTVAALRLAGGRAVLLPAGLAFVAILGMPLLRTGGIGVEQPEIVAACGAGWACTVMVGAVLSEVRTRREAGLSRARNDERLELARELHDVVAHHVTGIVVAAQAGVTVARTRPEQAEPALASIEQAGAEALAGMRRMVSVLRGGEEAGRAVAHGPTDVDALVQAFDPDGVRTTFERDPGPAVLPPGVGETAYRVVQEALTNVHRHAPGATAVHVELRHLPGHLRVVVRNSGGGGTDRLLRSADSGGFGLAGMAERVGALGGTLRVGPDGPGTWQVLAELPLGGDR